MINHDSRHASEDIFHELLRNFIRCALKKVLVNNANVYVYRKVARNADSYLDTLHSYRSLRSSYDDPTWILRSPEASFEPRSVCGI